jgi:hypothetical protein
MKKILFTLPLMILFLSINAQTARWGFTGGATLAQVRTTSNGNSDNTAWLFGTSIGVMADLPVSKNFSVQPVLQFLQKGGKESTENTQSDVRLNYLELPVSLVYHGNGEKGHFILGVGPSFSYGLYGSVKSTNNGQTGSIDIKFGSSPDDLLKPLEVGVNALTGYEWNNGMFVQFVFNHGFNNIYNPDPSENNPPTWKNTYFGLRVGYLITRVKK